MFMIVGFTIHTSMPLSTTVLYRLVNLTASEGPFVASDVYSLSDLYPILLSNGPRFLVFISFCLNLQRTSCDEAT